MRIGVDGRKIPRAAELGPLRSLDHGRELGMEGLFVRTGLLLILDDGCCRFRQWPSAESPCTTPRGTGRGPLWRETNPGERSELRSVIETEQEPEILRM